MKRNKVLKIFTDQNKRLILKTIDVEENIPLKLSFLQDQVNGSIDIVSYCDFGNKNVVAVVNDEGLLKQFQPTFYLINNQEVMKYPLVGNILLTSTFDTGEGNDLFPLTDSEIEDIKSSILTDQYQETYFIRLDQDYLKQKNEFYDNSKNLGFKFETVDLDDDFEL